jgi:nucleoid DNA-binding protein
MGTNCPSVRCPRLNPPINPHDSIQEECRADAKRAVEALETIVLEQLGNAEKVRIGGLVQLTVRVKPATKKRAGRNPATGEEITIAAKPASVDVRARPLAKAKAALPSVQKARRRLAA